MKNGDIVPILIQKMKKQPFEKKKWRFGVKFEGGRRRQLDRVGLFSLMIMLKFPYRHS
jgi:hypothetical protein